MTCVLMSNVLADILTKISVVNEVFNERSSKHNHNYS